MIGLCQAGIVRKYMNATGAEQQATAILASDYQRRTDGVPGGTLGPSLFEHPDNPEDYFKESALAAAKIQAALGGRPDKLYEAISSFESYIPVGGITGGRIKPVVYRGMPAAYSRALIFPASGTTIVSIHEDLANVRALAAYGLEIASTDIILAHNLYLRNRKGQGSLYMYGKKFTDEEKKALDDETGSTSQIAAKGYPYPESALVGAPVTRIDVESGDYVVFRADYPHKVSNITNVATETGEFRISWNGFFTLLPSDSNEIVYYWT